MNDWKAEFMAKLLGVCWHEWDRYETDIDGIEFRYCSCGVRTLKNCSNTPYPLHTAQYNPFTGSRLSYDTIDKIVEQMPEVWEEYCRGNMLKAYLFQGSNKYHKKLFDILSYDNFLQYLYDTRDDVCGWAWVECLSRANETVNGYASCFSTGDCDTTNCIDGRIINPQYTKAKELLIKGMEE